MLKMNFVLSIVLDNDHHIVPQKSEPLFIAMMVAIIAAMILAL
jgi:hypothetical protein